LYYDGILSYTTLEGKSTGSSSHQKVQKEQVYLQVTTMTMMTSH